MSKTVVVPDIRLFDDDKQEFVTIKGTTFKIQHSLVSLSKWEEKWHKPFLSKTQKTQEELIDYVRCMTITQNVNPEIYNYLPASIMNEIIEYMNDPMTATTIRKNDNRPPNRQIITAEVIYGWMIGLNIPMEFQKWHLNKLMTLIEVVNEQNAPSKKMGKNATLAQNRSLNAARRAALHTKG